MEEVQAVNRQDNHGTVHNVEVDFGGDDSSIPAIGELDGSVDGSDVDGERAEGGSKEHHLHFLVQEVVASWRVVIRTLEGLVVEVTIDEFDGEEHICGDGNHLEDDAAQHDSATHRWVLVVTSGSSGDGTTDTLNGERDNISGEEEDGI